MAKKAKKPEPNYYQPDPDVNAKIDLDVFAAMDKDLLLATIKQMFGDVVAAQKRIDVLETAEQFNEGYTPDQKLNVLAEVKSTSQKKASDLSQRYTVLLETNNPNLLDLGKLPYESILEVTFNLSEQKVKT